MKILVMGLSGSGKSYLSQRLQKQLNCVWINADMLRKMASDWDFSYEGRIRQAKRMKHYSDFESDFSTLSYFPLTTLIEVKKYLMLGKPKYNVKNKALATSNNMTKG